MRRFVYSNGEKLRTTDYLDIATTLGLLENAKLKSDKNSHIFQNFATKHASSNIDFL